MKLIQANSFFGLFETPMNLACTVKLGDVVNGQLIGRAFGNLTSRGIIFPHYSSPADPMAAVSRTNTNCVVPANHVGKAGTIYVTVNNDGAAGAYEFNAKDAEILILVVPSSDYTIGTLRPQFSGQGLLTCTASVVGGS